MCMGHMSLMTLDQWMAQQGLTQQQFAEVAGISQSFVSRILAGQTPSAATMRTIFRVTKGAVTPNDFFNDVQAAE